ncbi:hypothetical protein Pmar_PMAR027074 [Perkinsus marinus ATCC 50983]|uniref:Uncharacterized protein n=1 Tax=Perkinsus marinus (strain ATCC 50983 / TXsc) TaxID=423536 RepID=C5L2M3_PERM5|nr:hypothetical protein Pmar_PMAR027074 [Perkinsus marinus ATCC 50983]EER09020.1 hypothetical protein Pmar_PMAR027074 [Perkinsus marinus ATCC 50983]|eukprot:XP_002777204.1 hypothetical protein Pmar_PMAR027074 [Perkinsus marinus ATCC 50983]
MGNRSSKCCTCNEDEATAADSVDANHGFTEHDRRAIAGGASRAVDYSIEEWASDVHGIQSAALLLTVITSMMDDDMEGSKLGRLKE